MTTLRALFYADARVALNHLETIRRSPGRALIWLVFAAIVVAGIALRIARAVLPHHSTSLFGPRVTVDLIGGLTIAGFGLTLAHGSRMAGLFAHSAEARFIIGSPATPFVATLYVQIRDIIVNGARRGLALLYGALIYLPDRLGPGAFIRDLVLILAAFAAIAAVPLARQLLPRRFQPATQTLGWCLIVLGLLPPLRDLAAAAFPPPFDGIVQVLPGWKPGLVLLAGAPVQSAAIGLLLGLVGALFVYVARRAHDAYPELYELSMRRLQRTESLRSRMLGLSAAKAGANARERRGERPAAIRAPGGVLIFVWRAWTEYRRTNSARSTAIEAVLLLAGAYAAGRFTAGNALAILPFASTLSTLLFLYALARSAALAGELRRPIFWLADVTLFERLCGLALAHAWRMIAWFGLIAIGLAAGGAAATIVAASALGGSAAVILAVTVGYASYALLPHEIDQRGPLMAARWFGGYVLAIPPIAIGIVIAIAGAGGLGAIAVGSLAAGLESAALIGFAAWRLDRMSILLR